MVEEGAELFGSLVDFVGVLVEEGEEELFPALAITGLAGSAGPASEVLYCPVDFGRLVDAEFSESFVHGLELFFAPEDDPVELADGVGGVMQVAVVAGWGEEELCQRKVESEGEGEDLVGVELTVAVAFVSAFDRGDAGLGEALAQEPFQCTRRVLLGHPLLDDYLRFVSARSRPNTLRATAHDLKTFFAFVGRPPGRVTVTDAVGFISTQRLADGDRKIVRMDGSSGDSARTIRRRLSSVSGL